MGALEDWWEEVFRLSDRLRGRMVTLHEETKGPNTRSVWARIDREGDLHIEGQDLGPATSVISGDGEYEWFTTFEAGDVPRVLALLGGRPGESVLKVMKRDWSGARTSEMERRLRESDIPSEFYSC